MWLIDLIDVCAAGIGNTTPAAEFNFVMDPEAAHVVLTSAACPVQLTPWESCSDHPVCMVSSFYTPREVGVNTETKRNKTDPYITNTPGGSLHKELLIVQITDHNFFLTYRILQLYPLVR